MSRPRHGPRATTLAAATAALLAVSACGGDGGNGGDGGDGGNGEVGGVEGAPMGAEELRAAIEADASTVEDRTREVAPLLAEALGARVRGAVGNVEGCQGGSFDGPTAWQYLARGALERVPADDPAQLAERAATALEQEGWSGVRIEEDTPGQVSVRAGDEAPSVTIAFVDDIAGEALFQVSGRCLPVTEDGREAARDLIESREIIPPR